VQDIYLREVKGGDNIYKGVAIKALSDPAKGCRM
jgi:branched-chain amino acid transport system substrate-binding protein